MSRTHIDHRDIVRFAEDKVNLPKDKADEYRAQARRLREKLEGYLAEHPDFTLKKMLLSGSLAKGTALRSLNDIDVACYISGADAPKDVQALLDYLAERLRKAFPNFSPDQVKPQTYSVTVSFRGTGLDVDVVPILYDGDPKWYGNLVSQDDGSFLKTSIPLHLEFARKRKTRAGEALRAGGPAREVLGPAHEAGAGRLPLQVLHDRDDPRQALRRRRWISPTIPRRCSTSSPMSPAADLRRADRLQRLLSRLRRSARFTDPVQIIDPVNATNNVARLYTDSERGRDRRCRARCRRRDRCGACRSQQATDRRLLAEGLRLLLPGLRSHHVHSYSYTESTTFTVTHARHMAAKVATDLKRMQRFYGKPSDERYRRLRERGDRVAAGRLSRHRHLRLQAGRQVDRADPALHGARPRRRRRPTMTTPAASAQAPISAAPSFTAI